MGKEGKGRVTNLRIDLRDLGQREFFERKDYVGHDLAGSYFLMDWS